MRRNAFFEGEGFAAFLRTRFSRKSFLRFMGLLLGVVLFSRKDGKSALALSGKKLAPRRKRPVRTDYDLVSVRGENASLITRKAVDTLGGIGRFVRPGDVVVVKPNIGWDRTPEQAANTNPAVVGELVRLCREAGAKVVKVFDNPCNDARRTYKNSGIYDSVKNAGGIIYYVSRWKFYPADFPAGSMMADYPLFRDAIECDCFINVPVAKQHGLTDLTLSMKNLMGVCGGGRSTMHQGIERKLAELTAFVQPDLNVIDAYRILVRNGPTGGNLKDVEKKNTVIASADPVLADSYACGLFEDYDPRDIDHIQQAAKRGLGNSDVTKARIKELTI